MLLLYLLLHFTHKYSGSDAANNNTGASIAPTTAPEEGKPLPDALLGRALPFRIVKYTVEDTNTNRIKVALIVATVEGGASSDWAATGIAIAEQEVSLGAESVEVTLDRADLEDTDYANLYKQVSDVYFSPNFERNIWKGKSWSIDAAPALLPMDVIKRDADYYALMEKYNDQGMDPDRADELASKIIGRKYHQPKEWFRSTGGLTGKGRDRSDFIVDYAPASGSLKAMADCMGGKENLLEQTCP